MAYETISSEWANKENVGTLWAQIVANFVHAAPRAKGDMLYWGEQSNVSGANNPKQPSRLAIGNTGDFLSVNNGVPVWTAFGTPSLAFSDTTTDAPKLAITIQGKTSTAVALPIADATHSGIITTGAQAIAGAKTFKETVHSEKDVEADGGVSAYGIADLSMGGGGGQGTVIGITYGNVTLQNTYTPVDGIVTLPKSADNITWTSTNQSLTQTQKTNLLALYDRAPSALWNSGNEIADKSFVNSSIATATATFRGTVTATDDTDAAAATALATISTKDDNDYAFVKVENTPQTGVDKFKRYKYNGSAWVYEYTLNNSSFTSDQWNAINSGITTSLVTDIGTLKSRFTGDAANNALQLEGHGASYFATAAALGNYLLLTGGTLDAKGVYPLILDNTASGATEVGMRLKVGGTNKGALLYGSTWGTAILCGDYAIGVKTDGTPYYGTSSNKYKLWHENNDGSDSGLDADLLDGQHGSYYAVKEDTEDAVNTLASAIGEVSSIAYDNKNKIDSINDDVIELYGYFDGSSARHALSSDKLTTARTIWGQTFDGTANVSGAMSDVTNIDSLIYISSSKVGIGVSSPTAKLDVAGDIKTTDDISGGKDIYAAFGMAAYGITDLAMSGGGGTGTVIAIKFEGSSTQYDPVNGIITLPAYPSLIGYATQNWVTAQITALNLGTASTHAHNDYVTAITWDATNLKLKQAKGGDSATDIVQFKSLTIKGGTTSIGTYSPVSALEFSIVAGSNISVTPDATNHKITIANTYSLPAATSDALGGIKIADPFTISDGVLGIGTGKITNAMLAGSIANNKLSSGGKFTIGSQDIELGTTYTQDNFRSYLGLDMTHYSSLSDSTKDVHVITIGGKKLYLKFRATQADATTNPQTLPAFELAVADNAEGQNEQVFSFGTITEDWITTNCVLPTA